jgi:hypothetical protein
VIHEGTPVTDHEQAAGAVTPTLGRWAPPVALTGATVVDSVGAGKQTPAAWVSTTFRPAIVSVAERAAPVLALPVYEYAMVALPEPEVPEVIVIHEGTPVTVQLQEEVMPVNAIDPVPAALSSATSPGVTTASLQGFAACVTVKLLPATVKVAVRSAPGLAAALTLRVLLPVPVVVMLIQVGMPVTLQVQELGAVTATVDVPAADVNVRLDGEIVGAGKHGSAAWLTLSVRPAIVIVALRAVPGFA